MKYLQKFNESNENYITQADFDLIEDLFLFWSDQGNQIGYWQRLKQTEDLDSHGYDRKIENSEIREKCVGVVGVFLLLHEDYEFERIFGFIPSQPWRRVVAGETEWMGKNHANVNYKITNITDIESQDGPFPAKPVSNIQKILNVIDSKQNLKKDLTDILNQTKGLDYYGFFWSMTFDCNLVIYGESSTRKFEFTAVVRLNIAKK